MLKGPPDIEAEIRFLSPEEGGRHTPYRSGYRPNHDFGTDGMLNDAHHEYVGIDTVAPGDTVTARLWFLAPDYQAGRLYEGFEFTVQEGARIVGRGRVSKVINKGLERANSRD